MTYSLALQLLKKEEFACGGSVTQPNIHLQQQSVY